MANSVIKDGLVTTSDWTLLKEIPDAGVLTGNIILPLPLWNKHKADIEQSHVTPGLYLEGHEHPDAFIGDFKKIPIIAIDFPAFTDGRGFSLGRLLRENYAYSGELRAYGNFIRDQLFYLKRCGFNSFEFSSPVALAEAVKSLKDFTDSYQAASDQSVPLFRRRNLHS